MLSTICLLGTVTYDLSDVRTRVLRGPTLSTTPAIRFAPYKITGHKRFIKKDHERSNQVFQAFPERKCNGRTYNAQAGEQRRYIVTEGLVQHHYDTNCCNITLIKSRKKTISWLSPGDGVSLAFLLQQAGNKINNTQHQPGKCQYLHSNGQG
jgi:hypothetical protein